MTAKEKILALVPKVCKCGAPLVLSENLMHLTCTNPDCEFKFSRKLEIFAKAFGIDSIGLVVAQELVDYAGVKNFHDIFELTEEKLDLVPRYQDGMKSVILKAVDAVKGKEIPFESFIRGLCLKRVGAGTAKKLAQYFKDFDSLFHADASSVANAMEISTEQDDIVKELKDSYEEAKLLLNYVSIKKEELIEKNGMTAVITGSLDGYTRSQFQKKYESFGVTFQSSVSKVTQYLITNEAHSEKKTSKMLKAEKLGTKVVTQQEFEEMFA